MQRLENKICVITGAARGIGRAIAQAFVEQGANVVLTDIDAHEGTQVAAQLGARFIALDVSDEAQWDALAAQVPACDVVVNNAGITGLGDHSHPHDPENTPLSEWRRVHQINIDGTFLGCRYAIRAMKAKGAGSIINMSSRSGLVGIPGAAAYASSKAAIRNHTKSVALYCAGQGWQIRCNSVHPAAIFTPIWEQMLGEAGPERDAAMARMVADTPLKRFGQPSEVAALCLLLASDEATYITGSELDIDGGLLAGSAAAPK
jgi:3(or 17)beta-hydroxysteroid dehydrogenase